MAITKTERVNPTLGINADGTIIETTVVEYFDDESPTPDRPIARNHVVRKVYPGDNVTADPNPLVKDIASGLHTPARVAAHQAKIAE